VEYVYRARTRPHAVEEGTMTTSVGVPLGKRGGGTQLVSGERAVTPLKEGVGRSTGSMPSRDAQTCFMAAGAPLNGRHPRVSTPAQWWLREPPCLARAMGPNGAVTARSRAATTRREKQRGVSPNSNDTLVVRCRSRLAQPHAICQRACEVAVRVECTSAQCGRTAGVADASLALTKFPNRAQRFPNGRPVEPNL